MLPRILTLKLAETRRRPRFTAAFLTAQEGYCSIGPHAENSLTRATSMKCLTVDHPAHFARVNCDNMNPSTVSVRTL